MNFLAARLCTGGMVLELNHKSWYFRFIFNIYEFYFILLGVNAGKYAHLAVTSPAHKSSQSEVVLNFGSIPFGQTVDKFIEVANLSPVNSPTFTNSLRRLPTANFPKVNLNLTKTEMKTCIDIFIASQYFIVFLFP